MFYPSLMLNYFFSNGPACVSKKKLQVLEYQSSGMHFTKVQPEMPSRLLRLNSMG